MTKRLIGLTGGIASGKSAVAQRFEQLGADVIDTDVIAREVVEPGQPALLDISEHFGSDVLQADGRLNRAVLREKVFANANERIWLEALLHPLIRQTVLMRAEESCNKLVILVVPLLFETGQYQQIDMSLVVDVDTQTQRRRVQARDGVSAKQVEQVLAAQLTREERLNRADRVIDNTGSLEQLYAQVDSLYAELIEN